MHNVVRSSLVLCLLFFGCTSREQPDVGRGRDAGVPDAPPLADIGDVCGGGASGIVCAGGFAVTCGRGMESARFDCAADGELCFAGFGCGVCPPGAGRCNGELLEACAADGSGWLEGVACPSGRTCSAALGACATACEAAAADESYLGCEYWPTPVTNSSLHRDVFTFAVAVANPGERDAIVAVTRFATEVANVRVPPGELRTVELPWIEELQGTAEASALVHGGAYRLTSSEPVTVYQFNPLEYVATPDGIERYSYTNDASLLLPAHALTSSYLVISRPTHFVEQVFHHPSGDIPGAFHSPGFVAITAVGEAEVNVTFTAHTLAGVGSTPVQPYSPGDVAHFSLVRGDVLQLLSASPETCDRSGGMETQHFPDGVTTQDSFYCVVGPEYDLTGTRIVASAPVQVTSGHNCAFVPFNRWACDHLEEQLLPLETWGRSAIVSITEPLRGEPNVIRVVSGHDGNTITFEPASVHGPVTLGLGEWIELEVSEHVRVTGTQALAVAQFMVAQDYAGIATSGELANGDPAYGLAIPTEQFRTSYGFLAPETYVSNRVNVTAPMGTVVRLDGEAITVALEEVGTTGMGVARVPIEGGAHHIEADVPFGIVVYGFGRYTSYLVPGGLDLAPINAPF